MRVDKQGLYQGGGTIINVEGSCTTGVCWGLYSEGILGWMESGPSFLSGRESLVPWIEVLCRWELFKD